MLAELLQTDADLPVVMVSAFAQQADATDRGARGLIQKPFDSAALLSIVAEHIRSR